MKSTAIAVKGPAYLQQYNDLREDAKGGSYLRAFAQNTPNMTVKIMDGHWVTGDGVLVEWAEGNSGTITAPITNDRIDLISMDDTGALTITAGSESATPVVPVVPAGEIPLCQIYLRPGCTEILDTDDSAEAYIIDARPILSLGSSLELGETSSTAYRGDRGKTAYDHSQVVTGNPHGTSKTDLSLGNVTNDAQLKIASNLSDLANVTTAKTNLGLNNLTNDAQLKIASNLSDLASATTARTNLGLGNSATKDVGTATGTVMAGDDSRVVNAVPNTRTINSKALSSNISIDKTDVGLSNVTNDAQLKIASNLSDLNNAGTARTNLGLGNVSNDAQLKRAAGDFVSFTEKTSLDGDDLFLVEDSVDSNNKKKIKKSVIAKMTQAPLSIVLPYYCNGTGYMCPRALDSISKLPGRQDSSGGFSLHIKIYAKGSNYQDRTVTSDWASATDIYGWCIIGDYVYVLLVNSPFTAYRLYRYAKNNLAAGGTLMPYTFGTTNGNSHMFTDGTYLYFTNRAGFTTTSYNIRQLTINGTALDSAVDFSLSDSLDVSGGVIGADSLNIYAVGSGTLYKYNLSGVAQCNQSLYGSNPAGMVMYTDIDACYMMCDVSPDFLARCLI